MYNILAIKFAVNNASNVHIGNNKNIFTTLKPCTQHCVATIGGTDLEPEGIGTILIHVQDNEGLSSEMTLDDVLYFTSSPVNLISIACLANQYKDAEGTVIHTIRYHSDFTWNFGAHTKTIYHAQSRIPEMEVSTGKTSLQGITTAINVLHPISYNHVLNVNLIVRMKIHLLLCPSRLTQTQKTLHQFLWYLNLSIMTNSFIAETVMLNKSLFSLRLIPMIVFYAK